MGGVDKWLLKCESELPEGAFPFVGGFSAMEAAEEAGSAEVGGVTSVFFFTTGFLSFPEHMQWEFLWYNHEARWVPGGLPFLPQLHDE